MSQVDDLHDDPVSRNVPLALLLSLVRIGERVRRLSAVGAEVPTGTTGSTTDTTTGTTTDTSTEITELEEVLLGLLVLDDLARSIARPAAASSQPRTAGDAAERWLR